MNQLANPSVTTPRQGDRSRASRVSPRNSTGRLYAQQHAEVDARKSAANIDVNDVRRIEHERGHTAGYEAGFIAGWQALADHLVEIGVLEADDDGEQQDDE
jgi:hypothetical protein